MPRTSKRDPVDRPLWHRRLRPFVLSPILSNPEIDARESMIAAVKDLRLGFHLPSLMAFMNGDRTLPLDLPAVCEGMKDEGGGSVQCSVFRKYSHARLPTEL